MIFNNCSCTREDPENVLSHLSCGISKSSKRPTFTIELEFRQPVVKFKVNMRVVLPRPKSVGDDFPLFNLTDIDGCNLLSNKNQITMIKLGRENMDRFSNIPKRCPWPKDVRYYVRGYRTDMQTLPAFSFEADMHLWFEFVVNHNKIIKGFIQSRVQRRRGNKKSTDI
ncbi:uncharacterized protein [Drosophila tropicalis]|uniref:uncharacterized protein n=1 Tax=Drosophila tropicalis TaxID=46794 RepID=UPI0035AB84A5